MQYEQEYFKVNKVNVIQLFTPILKTYPSHLESIIQQLKEIENKIYFSNGKHNQNYMRSFLRRNKSLW